MELKRTFKWLVVGLAAILLVFVSCAKQDLPSSETGIHTSESKASLTSVSSFGTNPGNLLMYYYAPSSPKSPAPLVVALHGCTQSANEYADRTEWHVLANKYGFYVVFPQQQSSNNQNKCFNWFEPGDIARGQGEALSIKQMVDYMKSRFNIDSSKVFVTGLSAGGAMTSVMMATYPDVFAGGAVMAGIPYKCATTMTEGFTCMSGVDKTPQQWGDLVRGAYSGYSGPYPTLMVFQGSSDYTVRDVNMTELVDQWTNVHGTDQTPEVTETFRTATRKIYRNSSGKDVVVTYYISGMGHGITVDPGTNQDQGGTTGAYSEDKDIYSSYYAAQFWGLTGSGSSDTTPPSVNITSPSNGATVSGTVTIAASATDNVGVTKVEFYINNNKVGEDTSSPYEYSWNTTGYSNGTYSLKAIAYDAAGNSAVDNDTSVTVSNSSSGDTTPPSVNITSPSNGATVSGTVTIAASASDNVGVTKVEFYINNNKVGEDTSSPYEYSWNTTGYSNGTYSLKAIAYDAAGNSAVDNDTSVTVSNSQASNCQTWTDTAYNHSIAGRASYTNGSSGWGYYTTGGDFLDSTGLGTFTVYLDTDDNKYYKGDGVGMCGNSGGSGTTVSFNGIASDDGYVKANADGSSPAVGTYSTLAIGRGSDGKYNRAILSFDTSSLPDNATITRAYIVVTYSSRSGDPWANGNSLVIDVKTGYFGSASTTETSDWAASPTASAVASIASFTSGTKQSTDFNSAGLSAINKTGKTQLKLRFVNNQSSTAYIFIKEGADAKLYVTYR